MKESYPIIVQKYGGSSVATTEKIKQVAELIFRRAQSGSRLCVVVSAMGKTTDQLLSTAHEISENPSRRELDMLLSCGERASMALLAMALEKLGCPAVSLTGSQSGIITSDVHTGAKILELRPQRVLEHLEQGKVVIVAGFQGVSINREITTLGRGGSDTTAVAMAAALNAEACEIYSDVPGVFTADPKWVEGAERLESIALNEMEELSLFGAKVMHAQAISFARTQGITIHALKTGDEQGKGTLISAQCVQQRLEQIMLTHKEAVYHLSTEFHQLDSLLHELVAKKVFHVQCYGWATERDNRLHCLIHPEDAHGFERWSKELRHSRRDPDCSTISLVGVGLCDTPVIAARALSLLKANGFEVIGVSMAPNRCTFVFKPNDATRAVSLLHRHLVAPYSQTA